MGAWLLTLSSRTCLQRSLTSRTSAALVEEIVLAWLDGVRGTKPVPERKSLHPGALVHDPTVDHGGCVDPLARQDRGSVSQQEYPLETSLKLLVTEEEACQLLSLSLDDLVWLTATEQLSPLLIRGRKLFEVSRLHEFIQVYKSVQSRSLHV